jgi:hypothetical protein
MYSMRFYYYTLFRLSPFTLMDAMLDGSLVTMAWHALRMRTAGKEWASDWGLAVGLRAFHCKEYACYKIPNEPWIWADLKITCDKNE